MVIIAKMDQVCLVIKAANQKYEDIKINCNMSWTVGDLKNHLSINYPSKPKASDQRIIYSGHLLTDDQSLKNILGSSDNELDNNSIFTFHLVCPQKPASPPSHENSQNNSDVNKQGPSNSLPDSMPSSTSSETNPSVMSSNFSGFEGFSLHQQMGFDNSLMQQSYQALMNEYYQYIGYCFLASPTMDMVSYNAFANAFMQSLQQNPNLFGNVNNPTLFQSQPSSSTAATNNTTPRNDVTNNNNDQNRNNPVAAHAAVGIANDEPVNRDWTDLIYSFSKLAVMLSIIYFYSSFNRLMLLMLIFFIIYFYKNLLNGLNGPLNGNRPRMANQERRRHQIFNQLREAGNRNMNNNDPAGAVNEGTRPDNERQNNNNNNNNNNENVQDLSRFSGLRFLWVFVSSLFTSLIPDPVPVD